MCCRFIKHHRGSGRCVSFVALLGAAVLFDKQHYDTAASFAKQRWQHQAGLKF
jgi:hypothetical protein